MRIITERRLREFMQSQANAEIPLREWILIVRRADWVSTADPRQTFNSVDFHQNLTIFNVGGNNFRIIAKIEYQKHLVFIKTVLTHRDYNKHSKWCDCGQK